MTTIMSIGGREERFVANIISMCGAAPFALKHWSKWDQRDWNAPWTHPWYYVHHEHSLLLCWTLVVPSPQCQPSTFDLLHPWWEEIYALARCSTAATKSIEQNSQLTEHKESYCDAARVQIDANYCPPWKWNLFASGSTYSMVVLQSGEVQDFGF